ncbi:MAG: LacI family transcriptional regulator [Candidatus Atribacteria bacterium]|nr:MAG: LacI family transcriptional regulator [Candidatus Atribacteria bacterium]
MSYIKEKDQKVNIKYLAKIANVSIMTVSRALRKAPGVSKKNIEKINSLAKKLNYYPDFVAKNLRLNKTNTIGIIFNDVKNPFYSDVLWAIHEKLHESNYSMLISFSNWDINLERENISNLISKKVDGIIMSPVSEKDDNLKLLLNKNIEIVFVDSVSDYEGISYSSTSHKKAAYISTDYLIKCGHKDILLISVMPSASFSKQFLEGYKEALRDNNIKKNENLIFQLPNTSFDNCYKLLKELIKKKTLFFTGIIFISDFLAISFYKVANELGLKIPDDYSIVGFDNIDITSALNPPLTTINQSRKEIGYEAVRILLNNINNPKSRVFEKAINEPYLIIRDSVKKLE